LYLEVLGRAFAWFGGLWGTDEEVLLQVIGERHSPAQPGKEEAVMVMEVMVGVGGGASLMPFMGGGGWDWEAKNSGLGGGGF
jgi:hypothetical protein